MLSEIAGGIMTAIAVAAPPLAFQCAGDSPPNIGPAVIMVDRVPNGVSAWVDGPSGYVAIEVYCHAPMGPVSTRRVESQHTEGLDYRFSVSCPSTAPYLIEPWNLSHKLFAWG